MDSVGIGQQINTQMTKLSSLEKTGSNIAVELTSASDSKANFFADRSKTEGDVFTCENEVSTANTAVSEADKKVGDLTTQVSSLSSSIGQLETALQNFKDAGFEEKVKVTEQKIADAQQRLQEKTDELNQAKEDQAVSVENKTKADAALEKAKTALADADEKLKSAEEKETTLQGQKTDNANEIETVKAEIDKLNTEKKAAEEQEAKVKQGGVETTVKQNEKANGTETVTKSENSAEFKLQEKKNIETAKEIRDEFKGVNDADRENSQNDADGVSARTLQRQNLAQVEFTPELNRTVGAGDKFADEADSGKNNLNASTSTVRNKSEAISTYLDKAGIEPSEVDAHGNKKYSPADVYAAEYAVSALQPDIVNNAKAAEEYQTKAKTGGLSKDEVDDAIDKLKNGTKFEGKDRAVGDAGQKFENGKTLLTDSERNNLINKLEKGSTDLSQRELNALTYLQGTTDNQGFPTVPTGMEWILPDSSMSTKFEPVAYADINKVSIEAKDGNHCSIVFDYSGGSDVSDINEAKFSRVMNELSWNYDVAENPKDRTVTNDKVTWTSMETYAKNANEGGKLSVKTLIAKGKLPADFLKRNPDIDSDFGFYPGKRTGKNTNIITASSLLTKDGELHTPKGKRGGDSIRGQILHPEPKNNNIQYDDGRYVNSKKVR